MVRAVRRKQNRWPYLKSSPNDSVKKKQKKRKDELETQKVGRIKNKDGVDAYLEASTTIPYIFPIFPIRVTFF